MKQQTFKTILLFFVSTMTSAVMAQIDNNSFNQIDEYGNISPRDKRISADSLGSDKEIPKGMSVWTVDPLFGDRIPATPDTLSHMFMNSIFTTGLRGEYNTTGNLGAPRIHRVFADRAHESHFIFTHPYDFFVTPVENFHFTNTLSPITNLSYNTCGDKTDGEDHFKALFAVNANKRLGFGMKFDYLYGRGYYQNQSTSHFNYTLYGSYLGDRYQAHLLLSTNHQKVTENGGITKDEYITHPETTSEDYTTQEIPTVLQKNWNRNDNQHVFFSHRYNIGFNRKVKMTEEEIKAKKFAMASKEGEKNTQKGKNLKDLPEKTFAGRPENAKIMGDEPMPQETGNDRIAINGKAALDSMLAVKAKEAEDTMWLKNEYVPVTSFIHTVSFDNYKRIYQAYDTPSQFYANEYYNVGRYTGDSIYDKTKHYELKNTFAISLLEGFNKWAKAGLKVFANDDFRHFELPAIDGSVAKFNEHAFNVGGQLSKTQGSLLHYNVTGTFGVLGTDLGEIHIDANADLNFPLLGDTIQLAASGFFYHEAPGFYYNRYQSRHFWWDHEMDKTTHTRIQGILSYKKTRTTLRVAADEISNYTYFTQTYDISSDGLRTNVTAAPVQCSSPINVLTASLNQDFTLGILNWENQLTYQRSSNQEALPLPSLSLYSNLYIRFKIAHVLDCDFGADVRYFTKYYAPDYCPALGTFTVQGNPDNKVKIGNYPLGNIYANFHLKQTRFFVMYSHFNESISNKQYFYTPHYPLNGSILRFGLSWNFFN